MRAAEQVLLRLFYFEKIKVKKVTGSCAKDAEKTLDLEPRSSTGCFLIFRLPLETRKEKKKKRGKLKEEQKRKKLYQEKSKKRERIWRAKGRVNEESDNGD